MKIGVIAEDYSDFDVLYQLTNKLIDSRKFSFRKFIGHGCSMIRRKCKAWAKNLLEKGCKHLVILHDLDTYSERELRNELEQHIKDIGFKAYLILIPIREIEAWLLVDSSALQKAFSMCNLPKVPNTPELIINPKEKLSEIVWKNARKYYVNTIHNSRIAGLMQIDKLNRKCRSFRPYSTFISKTFS